MTEQRQDRVRALAELIRAEQYAVDPAEVADALLRHVRWEDVPDLSELIAPVSERRRIFRLPRVRWVGRLAVAVRTRPQLSA
ncbi:MAG TPA: hypothetical protein VE983_01640 [Solirubrobacteraceae bacterium]|nr:hypothetical protein [Solirubrobacteraceae bacterium]